MSFDFEGRVVVKMGVTGKFNYWCFASSLCSNDHRFQSLQVSRRLQQPLEVIITSSNFQKSSEKKLADITVLVVLGVVNGPFKNTGLAKFSRFMRGCQRLRVSKFCKVVSDYRSLSRILKGETVSGS